MSDWLASLKAHFRAIRERAGTLDEVARRARVNRSTVHKIETDGSYDPGVTTLRAIVELGFGSTLEEFFAGMQHPAQESEGEDASQVGANDGRADAPQGTLRQLLKLDEDFPAEDTWQGDVHKAVAALNRALRRPGATAKPSGPAQKAR